MTYGQIIETLQILAKYDGGLSAECEQMWADYDEHGIIISHKEQFTIEDIRKLASFGWSLGCDAEYNEEDDEIWVDYKNQSDDALREVFLNYDGIFKFE